jgi:ABC-2 type transport system permease protein
MIAAILRAQLLSMRIAARRGAIFSIVTGVVWYGIWVGAACAAALLAGQAKAGQLRLYLPMAFLGVCGYWQIIPVLSASMGSGLDLRKLLLYPVPHGKMFLVEILLRLVTGAEMVLVLAGGTAGLLFNPVAGGWSALPRLVCAALIFVLFNLLLASGMRSLLERLLTRRRVREVLSFFLLMLYVVPRFMVESGARPKGLKGLGGTVQALGLPWTAAARVAAPAGDPSGHGGFEWLALLSLCAWTLVALWFGRTQFERNLRYDAVAAQATPLRARASRGRGWMERFYRLPSLVWRDPLACMIEKELRSLARTPRFRMVFIMGFTFGLVVWFPTLAGRRVGISPGGSPYFLAIVCVYALTLLGQVTYWNCFGFDRSAAVFYFAAPQPLSRTLAGKNIAALFFIYLEVLVLIGVTAALGVSGGWRTAVETLLVVGVCSLYLLALGNIASVQYPRGLSPERVSQGGASSRFQGLIFILYPLALLPVFLAYLARYAFASELVFAIAMAIAAILGAVLYRMAMESAVSTATGRREQILQDLSKGDGPVVSE